MDYKALDIWLQIRGLVKTVYVLTKSFLRDEKFTLTPQMRGCIVSVSSNITEGYGRQSIKEKIHLLHIARGSLFELKTPLILANDLEYTMSESNIILVKIEGVKELLNGFINYRKKL